MNATAHRRGAWDRLPLPIRQTIREMCRERGAAKNFFVRNRLRPYERRQLQDWFTYANGEGPRHHWSLGELRSYPHWDGVHEMHLTPNWFFYADRFDTSRDCVCCRLRLADRAFHEANAVRVMCRWTVGFPPRNRSAMARSRLPLSLPKSGRQLSNGFLYPPAPP